MTVEDLERALSVMSPGAEVYWLGRRGSVDDGREPQPVRGVDKWPSGLVVLSSTEAT